MIGDVFGWLTDPAHWQSTTFDTGIWGQLGAHVLYCVIALAIALAVALPVGLWIGHTGKATWLVGATNAVRALPTVGVLVLLVVMIAPHFYGRTNNGYLIPTEIVLVLLAIPSIMSNTYAGVQNVEPAARDAAYGMGMTGQQVLFRVELPIAVPVITAGLRVAIVANVSIVAVAGTIGMTNLGLLFDKGFQLSVDQPYYPPIVLGILLCVLLALVLDTLVVLVSRWMTPWRRAVRT